MSSSPAAWTAVVPVVGATISMAGAVYVGWRQRRLTRDLSDRQAELADHVFRRQLCLTFASRALILAERASEIVRLSTAFTQTGMDDMATRMERLDNASDNFLEAWAEVVNWGIATPELTTSVDVLTDAMEATRLRILLAANDESVTSLVAVELKARECREIAVGLSPPGARGK